jgi:[ribosomal protein S5]-alanine N-acetyltransferase
MQIETPRLMLREFRLEDLAALAPILADPQVMKFSLNGVLSVVETQAKIAELIASYKTYGFGKWAVIYKPNHQLIGYCGIAVEDIDAQPEKEVGFRLATQFWGQGLATEAAAAVIQYGFEQFQFPYLLGIVEQANLASVRVLEKLGMTYHRETLFHNIKMDVYHLNRS